MSKKILTVLLVLISLVSFTGTALSAETSGDKKANTPKVLARVNGEDITEADLMRALQALGQQGAMMYGSEQGRKMIVDELISLRLFAIEGKNLKFDESPEFQSAVKNFTNTLLAHSAMREIIKGITISDEEAEKFYNDHKKEFFTEPEKVHAAHILISDDVSSKDVIEKIQAELKSGVSFDELAKKYSIEPGSENSGGDLGDFPKGVMVREFEETAFALKNPGDVSEPVKTRFGWHIIKLYEHSPEEVIPFNEEVKSHIIQELMNVKSSEILKKRSDELEKIYKVERF